MARIRTIKPEFWTDEKVVDLPYEFRLLFIGVWNFADDQGFNDNSPKRIKMQVFPGDDVDVSRGLARLLELSLLDRLDLTDGSGSVLHVRNWDKHQRISNPAKERYKRLGPGLAERVAPNPNGALRSPLEPSALLGKGEDLRKGSSEGNVNGAGEGDEPAALAPSPSSSSTPKDEDQNTRALLALVLDRWRPVHLDKTGAVDSTSVEDPQLQRYRHQLAGRSVDRVVSLMPYYFDRNAERRERDFVYNRRDLGNFLRNLPDIEADAVEADAVAPLLADGAPDPNWWRTSCQHIPTCGSRRRHTDLARDEQRERERREHEAQQEAERAAMGEEAYLAKRRERSAVAARCRHMPPCQTFKQCEGRSLGWAPAANGSEAGAASSGDGKLSGDTKQQAAAVMAKMLPNGRAVAS